MDDAERGLAGHPGSAAEEHADRSISQNTWTTKKIWPEYLHHLHNRFRNDVDEKLHPDKPPFLKFPASFSELVQLVNEQEDVDLPLWFQMPQIMAWPELVGYNWTYPHLVRGGYTDRYYTVRLWADQRLLTRIVMASTRTKRQPLCAPDFFFYTPQDKKSELKRLFEHRGDIPGIKWNLCLQTKKPKDHVDWPRLVDFVRNQLPTGEFLFIPSEWATYVTDTDNNWDTKAWDTTSFVRSVVEIDGYLERIRVRREIVDFVTALGYNISRPGRRPLMRRKWSQQDRKQIHNAARQYWTKWREEAERKLDERPANVFSASVDVPLSVNRGV